MIQRRKISSMMKYKHMPEKPKAYTFLAVILTPGFTTDTNLRNQPWDHIFSEEVVSI